MRGLSLLLAAFLCAAPRPVTAQTSSGESAAAAHPERPGAPMGVPASDVQPLGSLTPSVGVLQQGSILTVQAPALASPAQAMPAALAAAPAVAAPAARAGSASSGAKRAVAASEAPLSSGKTPRGPPATAFSDDAEQQDEAALEGASIFDGADGEARARAKILQLLRGHEVIRLFVNSAPGYGHQAASVTVLKRLRHLGYEGRVELVYQQDTKAKLGNLLPGFNPRGKDVQTLAALGVTAISNEDFRKYGGSREVKLGITGAQDQYEDIFKMGLKQYLRLQPKNWAGYNSLWTKETGVVELDPEFEKLGYVYDIPSPADPDAFVKQELSGTKNLSRKTAGLNAVLAGQTNYELLPAYGLGENGVHKLRNLIGAVHEAQTSSPASFRGGVVVPLISNLNTRELIELGRNDSASVSRAGWARSGLNWLRHALGLPFEVRLASGAKARVVSVRAPNLVRELRELKPGDILVVRVGALPQSVFEYVFSQASMPATVAGHNASNLMHLLGKPYLNTVGDQAPGVAALPAEERQLISDAHSIFSTSDSARRAAEFIVQAMDRNSSLSRFYAGLRPAPASLAADKLARGLLRLQELLEDEQRQAGQTPR